MDSWTEIARVPLRAATTEGASISSLIFDSTSNLIWCGDSAGYSSLFTPYPGTHFQLFPYTKFRSVHKGEVLSQLSHKDGILTLGLQSVNFNNRRGVCKVTVMPELLLNKEQADMFNKLKSFTYNCSSINDVVVGGVLGLAKFDLHKSNHLVEFRHKGGITKLHHTAKFLAVGGNDGTLDLFDPLLNLVVKQFLGHNGGPITDIDIQGSYIATCGDSYRPGLSRKQAEYVTDPLVNIYDVRMMKPLAPLSFPAGASFVRFHPKLPNIVIIALKYGQIQFVDIYDQSNVYVYQVDPLAQPPTKGSPATFDNLAISDNGDFLTFSDPASNNILLWSFLDLNKDFCNFPAQLDQPDYVTPPANPSFGVDDPVPLSTVGLPYYKDLLLSNFANDLIFTKELAKVPPASTITAPGWQVYDKAKLGGRNRYEPYQSLTATKTNPKFLSEKDPTQTPVPPDTGATKVFQYTLVHGVPPCYDKLEIQYSKFGVRDFDFNFFNHSEGKLAGLELQAVNSYINSVLQVYAASPAVYNYVVSGLVPEHLPNDSATILGGNPQGSSIKLETGYLFDMMHKALGSNVVISNLSQVLSNNPRAKEEGLVVDDAALALFNAHDLTQLLIKFNHFFLDELAADELVKVSYQLEFANGQRQYNHLYSLEVVAPPVPPPQARYRRVPPVSIANYIEYSLTRSDELGGNGVVMTVTDLPPVLLVSMCLTLEEFLHLNNHKKWLALDIWVGNNNGTITVKLTGGGGNHYQLLGYVAQVSHTPGRPETQGQNNLVTYVLRDGQWWLFNDFLVMPIPQEEVFNMQNLWKRPVMVVYSQDSVVQPFNYFDTTNFAKQNVDDAILYRDHFARGLREGAQQTYTLITKEEAPKPGTLVAIDAEFVTMKPDVVEVFADGNRRILRPRISSLARVSVLRGEGKRAGEAFIDNYIVHTLTIHDYLTNYLGIEPGDLDLNTGNKGLVTLQTAYRKLWLLLNMGCIFVGHGLYNDFRCINLHVPQAQICDTIDLYYKHDFKRQLSLKFLAYILLETDVQTGNHDSIEDAYTALQLFNKYRELQREGLFEQALNRIYAEGQQLRFRVPEPV